MSGVTSGRVRLLSLGLGLAAVAAVPLQLLWPKPSDGEQFSYADIVGDRESFWLVLGLFAVVSVVYLPLQALATMHVVPERGGTTATVGGVMLWLGAGFQAAGVASWATTYFVATDPDVDAAAGRAVIEAANADGFHLYGLLFPGVVLATLGTVIQCVALFRARTTPAWVPAGLLFIVPTFLIPSTGVTGLICTVPMTLGALGLAAAVRCPRSGCTDAPPAELPVALRR